MSSVRDGVTPLAELARQRFGTKAMNYGVELANDLNRSRDRVASIQRHLELNPVDPSFRQELDRISERLQNFNALVICVFETYEVLEMILLLLPVRDILLLQRVSKTFQTVIKRSHHLQRALYLAPSTKLESERAIQMSDMPNSTLVNTTRSLLGPWKFATFAVQKRTLAVDSGYEVILRYELVHKVFHRLQPAAAYRMPFRSGSWRNMSLSKVHVEHVAVALHSAGNRLLKSVVIVSDHVTMANVQETLCEIYDSTVASDSWRHYADLDGFRNNVDLLRTMGWRTRRRWY